MELRYFNVAFLRPCNTPCNQVQERNGSVTVVDVTCCTLSSARECMDVLAPALARRATSATAMNASSSRSHCVVTLQIARKGGNGETTMGKLCLVVSTGIKAIESWDL